MTAPQPGLPITLQLHVINQAGTELTADQIPSVTVGGKGKTDATLVRVELWNAGQGTPYFSGELHMWLRVTT